MTESMMRRVARAIRESEEWSSFWGEKESMILARAAMKAMRSPTKAMLNAGNKNIQGQANDPEWPSDPPFASAIWLSMAAAALDEKEPTP